MIDHKAHPPCHFFVVETPRPLNVTRINLKSGRYFVIDARSNLELGALGLSFETTDYGDYAEMDQDNSNALRVIWIAYTDIEWLLTEPVPDAPRPKRATA